jgi:hypothetical protein
MYYYIAKNTNGKIERATNAFLFVNENAKLGQLVRDTMFSFLAQDNENITLFLYVTPDKKQRIAYEFEFKANSEIQSINEKYSIQFQKIKNYYFCPTLYINM